MEEQKFRSAPNIQKEKPDIPSVRMENSEKTESHEPELDSEKKKKKTENINSILIKDQNVRLAPNIQKEEYDNSSVGMEKSEETIELENLKLQKKKELESIKLLPIKGHRIKPAAEIGEERSDNKSATKDHEREEIKRSTDSEINKLVWKAPSEVGTPEKDAGTRNIHPSG